MSGLPTPPLSERFSQGSSSGITMPSGTHIDTADFYRYGSPGPLMFLPLLAIPPHSMNIANAAKTASLPWSELKKGCVSALENNNTSFDLCECVHRRPTPAPMSEPDLTIMIVSSKDESWITSLDEIRNYIISIGFDHLQIEFIDPLINLCLITSPAIETNLARDWREFLCAKIISVIRPCEWLSLEICRMGLSGNKKDPLTVSVTLPATKDDITEWYPRRLEMIDILRETGYSQVRVDLGHGTISRATGGHSDPDDSDLDLDVLTLDDYTLPMRMGKSISLEDGESGTFGGILQLTARSGAQTLYGLTCWHVVADSKDKQVYEVEGKLFCSKYA